MKRRVKLHVVAAVAVAVCGLTATAIDNYFESDRLAIFSLLPYLLGVILGGTPHNPNLAGYTIGLILEWSIIGFAISGLVHLFSTPGPAQRTTDGPKSE